VNKFEEKSDEVNENSAVNFRKGSMIKISNWSFVINQKIVIMHSLNVFF